MSFAEWLKAHIRSHMLIREEKNNRRTVKLTEQTAGVRMTLRVENVPSAAAVIRFDEGKRRDFFEPGTGNNFLMRCDFLILDDSEPAYRATFIELKKSFEHEDFDRQHSKRGEEQLRWSLPSLKYLLSVFEVDEGVRDTGRRLDVSYFLIAKSAGQRLRKRKTREHFRSENHEGIVIHYSTKSILRYKDLISREAIPTV